MKISDEISLSARNLLRRKGRTALTLVGVGVAAAWGRGKVEVLYGQGRAEKLAKILPMASSCLMLILGGIMLFSGLVAIA